MVDIEAVELAVGREIDPRAALGVDYDRGGVEDCCSLGKAASQSMGE